MSARLVDAAIAAAGLDGWLARRLAGTPSAADRAEIRARIGELDPLLLGAIASRVCLSERGDVVRLYLSPPVEGASWSGDDAIVLAPEDPTRGLAFLREVALARLEGRARSIRVDAIAATLHLAQLSLAYGADAIVAPLDRVRLPLAQDGTREAAALLKERELAGLVVTAGRTPRVVEVREGALAERAPDFESAARRGFRAPGREAQALRERDELRSGEV